MENDIRMLIEERLALSRIELSSLFDGVVFNHGLFRQTFPMLPKKFLSESDKLIGSMLVEAGSIACQKIRSSTAYKNFISISSNAQNYELTDDSLQKEELTREECYAVVTEILPYELELHERINPRGELFLKNMAVSYALNTFLHLLLENDPFITITWDSYSKSDIRGVDAQWYGKGKLLSQLLSNGFYVANGSQCGTFGCYTNEVNENLFKELKSPFKPSLWKKMKRLFS